VKFAFIKEHLDEFPAQAACDALDVSRSGYYAWIVRPPSAAAQRRLELAQKIKAAHAENRHVYGSPRIYRTLASQGVAVCQNTVAKLMKQQGIRAKTKRKFVPRTTDSNHCQPIAGNLLDRQFQADVPDLKWAADITYIPTGEGWLYLAGVIDLCTRRIVGWSMADHMRSDLVADALRMAIGRRRPRQGTAAPQRPRPSVCQRRLPASTTITWNAGQHERQGRLLGQRHDGKLLGDAQERAGEPRAVCHAPGGTPLDLPVHRAVL